MGEQPQLPTTLVVAGGKGGVGKTTVAVNLSVSLARDGMRVGLVDADVHGPDALRLLGLTRRTEAASVDLWHNPTVRTEAWPPLETHGLRVVSAQMLLGEAQDFSAPGFTKMLLDRLLFGTAWGDTEILVVDLPPGTGEVTQHVLGSAMPAGALLVVTPQDVAHLDARKVLTLLHRWKTPILGGVENMAPLRCPCCDTEIELFPPTTPDRSIWGAGVERLALLPFSRTTVAAAERGDGPEAGSPDEAVFQALAREVRRRLAT